MDDRDIVREIGEVKAGISGLQAEVSGLRERIDDIVVTQLRDHGKRVAILERRQAWQIGWMAGAGAVGAALGKFFL
ncbi:hypothetical protein [Desulfovibrio piger]|uniref:hypothetical protein n=1 Tax=Desulfovibrio piger TaxID=901 RepID=UPI001D39210B|nr:hypothetical protein [Desulfovibrio piger]HJG35850.1 hypothetical protein [Desulfovibrio piger]